MDITSKRIIAAILKVLDEHNRPMGASALARELHRSGIDLRERMVRYYLEATDREGMTENLGRRGRMITDRGRGELETGVVIDKVGFIAARADEMAYRMRFDDERLSGNVIINISVLNAYSPDRIVRNVCASIESRLGMGRYLRLAGPGESIQSVQINRGQIGIATICSMTLNGILLRHGIVMANRFGGLLEMEQGRPVRFSQIIHYDGSTLDPLEIFIKSRMTSVRRAAARGRGVVVASFREIPAITIDDFQRIMARLKQVGLGCVLMVGKPSQPLLDIPVAQGRVGVIVAGGLNPIASVEEMGIVSANHPLHTFADFASFRPVEHALPAYQG